MVGNLVGPTNGRGIRVGHRKKRELGWEDEWLEVPSDQKNGRQCVLADELLQVDNSRTPRYFYLHARTPYCILLHLSTHFSPGHFCPSSPCDIIVRVCVKTSPAEGRRRFHTNTAHAHLGGSAGRPAEGPKVGRGGRLRFRVVLGSGLFRGSGVIWGI